MERRPAPPREQEPTPEVLGVGFAVETAKELRVLEEQGPSKIEKMKAAIRMAKEVAERFQRDIEKGLAEHHGAARISFLVRNLHKIAAIDATGVDSANIVIDSLARLEKVATAVLEKRYGDVDKTDLIELLKNAGKGALAFVVPGAYTLRTSSLVVGEELIRSLGKLGSAVQMLYIEKMLYLDAPIADILQLPESPSSQIVQ